MRFYVPFLLLASRLHGGAPEIMARVAVNQDRAEQLRARYVYRQATDIRVRDTGNRLVRQEKTTYEIFPSSDATQRKEVSFSGQYLEKKQLLPYTKSGEAMGEGFRNQADAHMAHNFRDDLTSRKNTRDGLSAKLFPLTSREQAHYVFTLKGEGMSNNTSVYRISFQPKKADAGPDTPWAGEVLVSREDFEPVQISTKLAHGIPFLVRTALGTNFKGLGFTVSYKKLEDGVWFPASYGAEFDVHVIFVYSRKISVSLVNTDFRKTSADATVTFNNPE